MDGIREIQGLARGVLATEPSSNIDDSGKELLAVFLDAFSIAKEANSSIVQMVEQGIKNGENAFQFVKLLLERVDKLEADLRPSVRVVYAKKFFHLCLAYNYVLLHVISKAF